MFYAEEEPESIKLKTRRMWRFINVEIQKVFYHSMGRLLNNKRWMNKYRPREMSREELLEAIHNFRKYNGETM